MFQLPEPGARAHVCALCPRCMLLSCSAGIWCQDQHMCSCWEEGSAVVTQAVTNPSNPPPRALNMLLCTFCSAGHAIRLAGVWHVHMHSLQRQTVSASLLADTR